MKKTGLFSAIAAGIFFFVFSSSDAHAATQLVQNLRTYRSGATYLQISWDTAERMETGSPYTFILQPRDNPSAQLSLAKVTPEPSLINGVPQEGVTSWGLTLGPAEVDENTAYNIWIEYPNGTTAVGTPLSTFSDYVAGSSKIVSTSLRTRTRNDTAKIKTIEKSYLLAGDTFRVYGSDFGPGPSDLTTAYAHIGPNGPYIEQVLFGDYYDLPILKWTETYIELRAPSYDATKLLQAGLIYFDDLVIDDANYEPQFYVKMVPTAGDVDKTIQTRLSAGTFRYLLNATRYRYNTIRTTAGHIQEATQMKWVTGYLKKKKRTSDATWSVALANAIVYGGYSQDEIKHQIFFGPGCIHAYFPRSVWATTADYAKCMSYSLP